MWDIWDRDNSSSFYLFFLYLVIVELILIWIGIKEWRKKRWSSIISRRNISFTISPTTKRRRYQMKILLFYIWLHPQSTKLYTIIKKLKTTHHIIFLLFFVFLLIFCNLLLYLQFILISFSSHLLFHLLFPCLYSSSISLKCAILILWDHTKCFYLLEIY